MGSSASKPSSSATAAAADSAAASPLGAPPESACPVQHSSRSSSTGIGGAVPKQQTQQQPSGTESACPVMHKDNKTGSSTNLPFNVYSQPIDPSNQMPSTANQKPSPLQQGPLSTDRVKSSIPKGNTADADNVTWTYPSPQMFFNALARKGKLSEEEALETEQTMESVVAIHNNMNERTWQQVLEWERVQGYQGSKLLKFMGRPHDLSPKARFKHVLLGHPLPFDRHDWTVQRTDGSTVLYVIDYYHNDDAASEDEKSALPTLTDRLSSLLVDVRPSYHQAYARLVQMPLAVYRSQYSNNNNNSNNAMTTDFEYLPLAPSASLKTQVEESKEVWKNMQKPVQRDTPDATINNKTSDTPAVSVREATALSKSLLKIQQDCAAQQQALNECRNDQECTQATLDYNICLASTWCPTPHQELMEALTGSNNDDDNDVDEAVAQRLLRLTECVQAAQERTQLAREQHASVFTE